MHALRSPKQCVFIHKHVPTQGLVTGHSVLTHLHQAPGANGGIDTVIAAAPVKLMTMDVAYLCHDGGNADRSNEGALSTCSTMPPLYGPVNECTANVEGVENQSLWFSQHGVHSHCLTVQYTWDSQ